MNQSQAYNEEEGHIESNTIVEKRVDNEQIVITTTRRLLTKLVGGL